jgi:AcrR family transcriptional regulator
MRINSERVQRAIAEAALTTFCRRGYGSATLEEIGAQVGLTRGAVLHHFHSKARLLGVVVDPCRQALVHWSMTTPQNDSPSASERRHLLTRYADLFLAHRGALRLLANDVSARVQLGLDDQWLMPPEPLVTLLVGSGAPAVHQVRVLAAIGALIQPVIGAREDLDNSTTRAELVDGAVAVLQRPRARAFRMHPETALASEVCATPLAKVADQ